MKTVAFGYANGDAKASYRRHFSYANSASLRITTDVGIVTSIFAVVISILSMIIKNFYKDAGYAYASS